MLRFLACLIFFCFKADIHQFFKMKYNEQIQQNKIKKKTKITTKDIAPFLLADFSMQCGPIFTSVALEIKHRVREPAIETPRDVSFRKENL